MRDVNVLRRHIHNILKRPFYQDKWIGDKTLLSILHTDFDLYDVNKWFLNRYLQQTHVEGINQYQHIEYKKYVLGNILADCPDFKEDK